MIAAGYSYPSEDHKPKTNAAAGSFRVEAGKCSRIGWFPPDKIPTPLSKISQINLAHYLDHRDGIIE